MEKENQQLLLSDFDYYLPTELIAQTPLKNRDNSKLLVLNRENGDITHVDKSFEIADRLKKTPKEIVDEYLQENPYLAKNKHIDYVLNGVASHHAGLLPGWKVLVEKLFGFTSNVT